MSTPKDNTIGGKITMLNSKKLMVKQECQKGATIKLNPCTYTKDGYYFKYWENI